MAAISEILSTFSRQPHFGHRTVAGSLIALPVLAVLGWMQSMYSGPIPDGFLYFAMLMALAAIVPVGLILFNWIGTMTGGAKRQGMPLKYALGAVVLIVIGLAGKLVAAVVPVGCAARRQHLLDRHQLRPDRRRRRPRRIRRPLLLVPEALRPADGRRPRRQPPSGC